MISLGWMLRRGKQIRLPKILWRLCSCVSNVSAQADSLSVRARADDATVTRVGHKIKRPANLKEYVTN